MLGDTACIRLVWVGGDTLNGPPVPFGYARSRFERLGSPTILSGSNLGIFARKSMRRPLVSDWTNWKMVGLGFDSAEQQEIWFVLNFRPNGEWVESPCSFNNPQPSFEQVADASVNLAAMLAPLGLIHDTSGNGDCGHQSRLMTL